MYTKGMLRSQTLDERLVRVSSSAGAGYLLNRDYASVLRKVEGEPGVNASAPISHAAREALAAFQIASIPQVERVKLGDAAYRFIHGQTSQQKENCDVVGVLTGGRGLVLGEAKGTELLKSLRQITSSAKALSDRGVGVVRSSVLVAPAPHYLECPPGLVSVSQARGRWRLSSAQPWGKAMLEAVKNIGFDPQYDYLIVRDNVFGSTNGLGLAVPKTGDACLYTNREWTGSDLLPDWRPIRKLKIPAVVDVTFLT